jgi:polyhydroxyalkanoate synthesis repressor PhaR
MHRIKKYSNRKLYDTTSKSFVTIDDIAAMIEAGEEIVVIDNTTGEDITTTILSQLLSKNFSGDIQNAPSEFLTDLLRKGGGEFFGYARKQVDMWHRAASLTSGGIDKIEDLINLHHKKTDPDEEDIESDMLLRNRELENWMTAKIDEGVKKALQKNQRTVNKQIESLQGNVKELMKKFDALPK